MRCSMLRVLTVGLLCRPLPALAATIHVPGDQPTIQAGVNAASPGDTVLVASGTYYEHDIVLKSGICLRSETEGPLRATIDAQRMGPVFICVDVDSTTTIEWSHIVGGLAENGGGMYLENSSPRVYCCGFHGNEALVSGGAVYCTGSQCSPVFSGCKITGNRADAGHGGGIALADGATLRFWGGTIAGNSAASDGGGIFGASGQDCDALLDKTILWGNCSAIPPGPMRQSLAHVSPEPAQWESDSVIEGPPLNSQLSVFCSDAALGENVGGFDIYLWSTSSFSADPLFCDPVECGAAPTTAGDYSLRMDSPCLPGHHPQGCDGDLIGSCGLGCPGPSPTEKTTWGGVKSLYQ